MSTTSMSLESLHFLLQHMEANKRFEICQRCPALREFEKSVPLKINCLVLTENSVIVNNTTYEIGIIRKCKVGETPSHVAKSNEKGGDPYEIDGYGIRDELDILTVTPGDMVINPRDHADFETSLEALFPILNESSYPLKKLVIDDFSNEEATSPIVKTAGILGIRHISTDHVQIISAITNPVVHLKVYELPTLTTPFKELVEHWIVSKRPLGYEYTFYYYDEPGFAIEMEDIFKKLNGKPINDENVIIPMSVDTQLKVSYGNFPEFAPSRKWAFRFLTETVEH
ncbi:unnamed protein product [Caenorhabditis brenneri]